MILQTLSNKEICPGIFKESKFTFEEERIRQEVQNTNLSWSHSQILQEEDYKYIFILCRGEPLVNFSPNPEKFTKSEKLIQAQQKASKTAKLELNDMCFFDLIPRHQLFNFFHHREVAMKEALKIKQFQQDYDILHKAHVLSETISTQNLTFGQQNKKIKYDIFGSITGRLTTRKNYFPILSLKKEERRLIKPQNDAFVELDLNAAELRMLLALSGTPQPTGDLHSWVASHIYNDKVSRKESKQKLFSWLYNFSAPENELSKFFSRQIFRDFYNSSEKILKTPFGREIKVEERKAQNYLLQSSTSDQVLENSYKILKFLKGRKSKVAFTLHDSIVLDFCKEDAIILENIKNIFESTRWGRFSSTCKIGKNFENLQELKI